MKKFIYKALIFFLILIPILYCFGFLANGYTDPFYNRFTTPKQKNLILGTSRAAQGLHPSIFKKMLNIDISNYAFTVAHSPFGPKYLESIKKKITKDTGAIFIVTVDPWSISSWCDNPNDPTFFRENKLSVANMEIVNWNPNWEYLFKNIQDNFYDVLISNKLKFMYLHKDGWLEVKNIPMDSLSVNKRIKNKIRTYKEKHLPKTKFSSYRLKYLINTITFLNEYGNVILVRLPVHKSMREIENKLMPNYDTIIKEAILESEFYLDLTKYKKNFLFTDGNHLYRSSGKEVSEIISKEIKSKIK